jgi:hypothetical protein
MVKIVLAAVLLVLTNLATFGYATWRCRQEATGQQRLLATAEQEAQRTQSEMAKMRQRLSQLQVWGELIELQQDVNAAHASMNRLNFGDALGVVDRVQRRLEAGEYGELFQRHRDELNPHLELARRALRAADASAHGHLVDLDQRAFQILAGVSSPGDFPSAQLSPSPPSATPAPSPAPSPLPSAAPSATPGPGSPAGSPAPTPRPV